MTQTKDAAFWTRHASRYAKTAISDMPGYERTVAHIADLIAGRARVLELGCGTGMTAMRLAPVVDFYHATDLSPGMIAQARARLGDSPPTGLDFTVATAHDLAAQGVRFDAIIGLNYLHLMRDFAQTLAAIRTMLNPGGLFISKTPLLAEMSPLVRAAIRPAQWLGLAPHVLTLDDHSLQAALVHAGFQLDEVARHGSKPKDFRIFLVASKP